MIVIVSGDILKAKTDAIVNPVNCVGVMGKGLALQIKERWPSNFQKYYQMCQRHEVRLGKVLVVKLKEVPPPTYIINFPTKDHWKNRSYIESIEEGLHSLRATINSLSIKSIAIPALGTGLGGLKWEDVLPLVENVLTNMDQTIMLYEPC